MKLTIEEARHLSERTLIAGGYTEDEANKVTQHIMDTELRGLDYGGLARTLSIFERSTKLGYTRGPIEIVHETPLSALVDGRNTIGYLVARFASAHLSIWCCSMRVIEITPAFRNEHCTQVRLTATSVCEQFKYRVSGRHRQLHCFADIGI